MKTGVNSTHGMSGSSVYQAWSQIKDRCHNTSSVRFGDYGGRGIKVCDRWLESFENFYEDMGDKPSKDHSLDRIDNDGDYCPENCRWATRKEQQRNTRRNRIVKYRGVSKPLVEWCDELGLHYFRTHEKLNKLGWTPERAFTSHKGGVDETMLPNYYIMSDSDMRELDRKEGINYGFSNEASGFASRFFDNADDYRLWKWFNGLDREELGVDTGENYGGYDE